MRFGIVMSVKEILKNLCIKLGENNKPIYAVMAIAVAKGIFRPTFTMMDKHEDPETKKYAALRELLTEVVAIPTYWVSGELASKGADMLNLAPEKKAMAKTNFMFLGVCTAALLVIPAVTSLIIKPVMNTIQNKKEKAKPTEQLQKVEIAKPAEITTFKGRKLQSPYNLTYGNKISGMKVGGLW